MTLEGSVESVAEGEDFGLSGHLAALERLHREALAEIDALVRPWSSLWSPRFGVASSETEEPPVTGQPLVPGAHASAA
jgi:hypothetical protein